MLRTDFSYDLPQELIAQLPLERRDASRLLCLPAEAPVPEDRQFSDIEQLLNPGDLLVMNDTRVIPARLYGKKASGGRVEILLERLQSDDSFLAQIKASKSPKPGGRIHLDGGYELELLTRKDNLFELRLLGDAQVLPMLADIGHIPLPPYIQRADDAADHARYQTVYADKPGAVAAPTAGLHFDTQMLERLQDKGVRLAKLTLHVGAGTFQPVRVEVVEEHHLHQEWIAVGDEVVEAVQATRAAGGRVVAVGTTSVRALESATRGGEIKPMQGDTDIFIYPGFQFQVVDAMITNFHLPESSLLMLVSAFSGTERVLAAYRYAVEARYRFFSYGDAMWLTRAS